MMQQKGLIPSLHGRDNCSHEYGVSGNLIFLSFQQGARKMETRICLKRFASSGAVQKK